MADDTRYCVDCHFLVKWTRIDGETHTYVLNDEERRKSREGDYGWVGNEWALACDFRVWDEGTRPDTGLRSNLIMKTNRSESCFFRKYHPGMLLPAARILQEREMLASEARKDRRLTIYGLYIAAIGLVVNAVVSIASLILRVH